MEGPAEALKELCRRRMYVDTDRVGTLGMSMGSTKASVAGCPDLEGKGLCGYLLYDGFSFID